jgi:hypothetical protein
MPHSIRHERESSGFSSRETEMFDCEIASAAINDIHMNQAYKNTELKPCGLARTTRLPRITSGTIYRSLIRRPSCECFGRLAAYCSISSSRNEYLDDTNEADIDDTDCGWYGQSDDTRDIQKPKPKPHSITSTDKQGKRLRACPRKYFTVLTQPVRSDSRSWDSLFRLHQKAGIEGLQRLAVAKEGEDSEAVSVPAVSRS